MSQIKVKGEEYACGKLNALAQFHVVRRLGPMLVVAGISVEMLRTGMKVALDDMVSMAGPVMELLSKMSDKDVDYILFTCLAVVKRKQGDQWAPITVKDTNQLMFHDIDMPAMIRLVVEVLKENLAGFLTELGAEPTSPSS
jgi:hypothetical protein